MRVGDSAGENVSNTVEGMKKFPVLALLVAVTVTTTLVGCADNATDQAAPTSEMTTTTAPTSTSSVAPTTTSTTPANPELRTKVAQLMMVGVRNFDDALAALEQGAGGIFIGSDTEAAILTTPGRDIAELRNRIGRPFAVSIDFEGGRVLRHPEVLGTFPSPRTMAKEKKPEEVRGMAYDKATSLARHGITVDFAPVVDIDGAGLEVVGDRAFSDDPAIAAEYASAFAQGMLDGGVMPVFKHFPGHGRASGDSHLGTVVTPPLNELQNFELVPYRSILATPGVGVMVGHMATPGLGDGKTPSSINPAAYQLLRSGSYEGGRPFDGPVFTDDLSGMKAISNQLTPQDAAATAIIAGADQALWLTTDALLPAIDTTMKRIVEGALSEQDVFAKAERVSHYQR